MVGPAPILPVTLRLPPTLAVEAVRFPPGHTMDVVVQSSGGNLHLLLRGAKVPVDRESGLVAGQRVTVEMAQGEGGAAVLRVRPQDLGAAAQAGRLDSALPRLLADTLRLLGVADPDGDAPYLAPAVLAHKGGGLRSLLALFAGRAPAGKDLQFLSALLQQAAQAGALPATAAAEFAWLTGQLVPRNEADIDRVLRRIGRDAARSVESRLAAALRGDPDALAEAIRSDLRGTLARLLEDEGLTAFLRARGQWDAFRESAQGLLDRLGARDSQNLRALDQPYLFFEVPFPPGAPIEHACIHFWGRDGGRRAIDPANAEAVLDLSTTVLGDLWIALSLSGNRCQCTFRATRSESVEILAAAAPELEEALQQAGYPGATVRTAPWDGNRFRETAALMRRMGGVDLTA